MNINEQKVQDINMTEKVQALPSLWNQASAVLGKKGKKSFEGFVPVLQSLVLWLSFARRSEKVRP